MPVIMAIENECAMAATARISVPTSPEETAALDAKPPRPKAHS